MNTKNRLIEQLLRVAKRHKILTYPVLALVALISIFSYFFNWSTGAGKRVVAIIMVMVMLVSQSYFLTSSATEVQDSESDALALLQEDSQETSREETPSEENPLVDDSVVTGDSSDDAISGTDQEKNTDDQGTVEDIETTETTEQEDPTQTLPAPEDGGLPVFDVPADGEDITEDDIMPMKEGDRGYVFYHIPPNVDSYVYARENKDGSYTLEDGQDELLKNALNNARNDGYYVCNGWFAKKNTDGSYSELIENLAQYRFTPDKNNNNEIHIYAEKILQKYKVTIVKGNGVTYDNIDGASKVGDDGEGNDVYDVTAVNAQEGSFTIINPTKYGHNVSGATISGGGGEASVSRTESGRNLFITLNGDESHTRKIILDQWEGSLYTFGYAHSEQDSEPFYSSVYFDDEEATWLSADAIGGGGVKEKTGYTFKGWQINIDGETHILTPGEPILKDGDKVQNYLYDSKGTAVLYPYYEYNEIDIVDGDAVIDRVNRNIDITYEYKVEEAQREIWAEYQNGINKEGEFEFKVTAGNENAQSHGIYIESQNGKLIVRTEGGPTARTKEGPIKVTCQVSDKNAPDEEKATVEFTITITVNKQTIKEVDKRVVSKVYDGTTDVKFNKLADNKYLGTNVDYIYVDLSDPGACYYDSKNVGDNRIIYITGNAPLVSTEPGIEDADNYQLPRVDGKLIINGVITPRLLHVTTSDFTYQYGRGYVRAGEENNPTVKLQLDDVTNRSSDDYGLLEGDELSSIVETYIADYYLADGTAHERVDNDLIGATKGIDTTYYVEARAKTTNNPDDSCNNYKVVVTDRGEFRFVLEEPEEDTNYIFVDENNNPVSLSDNLWLGGENNKIIPKPGLDYNGYDQIRVGKDGTWASEIKLSEAKETDNGELEIQLRNTHLTPTAFTSLKTIRVKVDSTAPTFQWVKVSQEGTSNPGDGFYFPAEQSDVSFGNYYNNTIHITVAYKDTLSGPRYLYYNFKDGNLDSTTLLPTFGEADEEGIATATFEIPLGAVDKIGYIDVCAEDLAGNVSDYIHLTRNGEGELEWAVEQTKPGITANSFYVESTPPARNWGTRPVVNGSTQYYANCTAYISATDNTSGIYGVSWYVTGDGEEEIITERADTVNKQNAATFSLKFKNNSSIPKSKSGLYTLYATVRDNAGNVSEKKGPFTFYIDDVPPVIILADNYDNISAPKLTIRFDTYDELSGARTANVYKDGVLYAQSVIGDGQEDLRDTEGYILYHYHIDVTEAGVYTIVVTDEAGNEATEEINLGGISSDMPECPEVTFNPEVNKKGWITSKDAVAQLENVRYTRNREMEAATYYELWKDTRLMKADHLLPIETSRNVDIPEGIYRLHVWSQSYTGVQCFGADTDSHFYDLYVDGTAPKIEYQLQRGSDNSVTVTFTITDAVDGVDQVSGVDKDTIKVLHGKEPVLISLEELESGDGYTGTFKVTENGTYTIQAADIAGNVADEEAFSPMSMKINAVKNITESSATVGAKVFKGTYDIKAVSIAYRKTTDTVYTQTDAVPVQEASHMAISAVITGLASGTDYVYKITAVSEGDEVLEYEGYFRTLSAADVGVTVQGIARYADYRDGSISIGLIRGNNYIRAVEMTVGPNTDNIFTFTNVPDGSYNLVATDGDYTKSIRVLIEGNKIIYPETGIALILGYSVSTSVDIKTKDTPDVSAEFSWMDNLLTDEDRVIIENGGNVEYKLIASVIRITNIDTAALSAMYAVAGTDKIVGAYLDLTLYKIVTDKDGNVTQKPVSELLNGASVSVTIPLGDMTGKSGLMVVRIHQAGSNYTGRYLPDQDINPSTYTITTSQFSTYAVLYDKNQDGQSSGDTITGTPNRGADVINGSYKSSVKKDVSAVEVAAVSVSADDDDTDGKTNTNSSSKNSVGSLRSASTAKTGDEAPIALAGIMMMFAMSGLVVLRKKAK